MSANKGMKGVVIGSPITHSLSPVIYAEAFRSQGVEGDYERVECSAEQLPDILHQLWQQNIDAVSVTMPLKEKIVSLLASVDDDALALGAVNCLSRGADGWVGHNTDGDGCCDALTEQGGVHLPGKSAVILGAGGTALSIALAMVRRGVHVVVVNRSVQRAEELLHRVSPFVAEGGSIRIGDTEAVREAHVLVNATSVGMNSSESPIAPEYLHSGLIILDAVYQPMKTHLLSDCEAVGAVTIDGLWMLIQQARRQCVYQFGWKPEAQPLRVAAERELASRRK